ncbi:hypothetical protein A4A49_52693 [Nicotiana attenuata]|uniref:Uncharacterized protein n=1 Tax=Nicotiana attenuata TaxID=49451 RepID=A0A1J6LBK9_NICAT|nr:hypothetical protein A4A49_52693 [Nicotiana attenuata]
MASSSTSSNEIERKQAICKELDELRDRIRELDLHMKKIMGGDDLDELLITMMTRAPYLKKEAELEAELEKYNMFYRRYL